MSVRIVDLLRSVTILPRFLQNNNKIMKAICSFFIIALFQKKSYPEISVSKQTLSFEEQSFWVQPLLKFTATASMRCP